MKRIVWGVVALALFPSPHGHAQSPTIDALKGKIFDAHLTEKIFANGLKFCSELDGKTSFYFAPRNRVLNLEDYHQSLERLAAGHTYNPETRRPWNSEDAAARWERVKQESLKNKADCDLVASLPRLEKQVEELQQQSAASGKKD